jgi:diguanylate cyclase (GGDEF)-like protein/PAS domain S-box-containing protein
MAMDLSARRSDLGPIGGRRRFRGRAARIHAAELLEVGLERAHAEAGDQVRERTALLRQSHAWLQDAQKLAQLGSWEWNVEADTETWSDELYRIYGVSPADYEPGYDGYIALVHPDDRARVEAAIRAAFADRVSFAFDERIVRPDGNVRTLASRGKVFVDAGGHATRMLGICQDVTKQRRDEGALREAEERARRVVEDAHAAFVSIDASGVITGWNPRAESIFGWSRAEAIGRDHATTILPERYRAAHKGGLHRLLPTGESRVNGTTLELEALRRDGAEFPVELSISAIPTEDGHTFNALVHDISDRKQAERAIVDAQERFRGAFEEAPIGMALMDLDGRFEEVNGALCEITGYSREELADTLFESIIHPDDTAEIRHQMNRVRGGQASSYKTEKRYVHASGHQIWLALQATLLRDANGEPGQLLAQLLDISDRRRNEDELQHLADHDPLTDLLNRRSFERELESHLDRGRRYGMEGAVLLLDLDQFKDVNDSLGHKAGDDLIVGVAHALRARLRETDVLARLGGDEFAVLLLKADVKGAQQVARHLLTAVREQEVEEGSGGSRSVTASLGVGMIDEEDGLGAEHVMVNADLAMYDAKEAGRDRMAVYSADRSSPARTKGHPTWIERIRGALEQDPVTLLAQPIVDPAARRAAQHELLLRMKDETGNPVPPGAFPPIAEQFDLVHEIDRWVVRSAVSILEEQRGSPLTLEVNLSGRSLGDPELLDLIVAELGRARVSPERLIFEITETAAVANMAAARSVGERLSKLGCRFALGDFGAGFGSLHHLEHLPFDFPGIDGEFVRNRHVSHTDQLLIGAVVNIARGLGKQTAAELVGDLDTVEMLPMPGVDYARA